MENHLDGQINMLTHRKQEGSVPCLGLTFNDDKERRDYFIEVLREKLPELRKLEGFPVAENEAILALSDPPYYTACPNPFIPELIEQWENEREERFREDDNEYHREPFAADVSEGKMNPFYNAHIYHTKVPHKAIMRYILHYTNPGDIVFDGFCGSGMTGVAASLCKDAKEIEGLGLTVRGNKIIDSEGNFVSWLGERKAVLSDLSPSAAFIAYSYNLPDDISGFEEQAKALLDEVRDELGWMYQTDHVVNGRPLLNDRGEIIKGTIHYMVWSNVYICPECGNSLILWEDATDQEKVKVKGTILCNQCKASVEKGKLEKEWETVYDPFIGAAIRQAKSVPVLINYTVNGKSFEKIPDENDLELLKKIDATSVNYHIPIRELPEGYNTAQPVKSHGYTHVHHFYTRRNLLVQAALRSRIKENSSRLLHFWLNSIEHGISRRVKHGNWSFPMSVLSGTLYVPALSRENNPFNFYENKYKKQVKVLSKISERACAVTTQSSSSEPIPDNSIDYIFVDPPFGGNLMYSELNFFWESWMNVLTNNKQEAIVNKVQNKGQDEYQSLMTQCFLEFYRILKPGHWITVEFSNSKASIWNAIQESLQRSGFIIANVAALDKKQGTHKALTTTTAVKQDLVISAYKPSKEMQRDMGSGHYSENSIWTFVRNHLEQLPVFIGHKGAADIIVERTPRVLFDRMVAYHVQNGFSVPISSAEFQSGVIQRFPMRDGMVFLESQVAEYDRKRILAKEFIQMSIFVSDENSAIEWLRQRLLKKPQTRQDLHPDFMKEIQHIAKYEKLPELDDLLEQNFLRYDGVGPVPSQIHAYLSTNFKDLRDLNKEDPALISKAKDRWYVPDPNKQADLEKLREKSLMREFESYLDEISKTKKKLRQFRLEAIRAGFKKAWADGNYKTIIHVGSKLPENVLNEDDKLLMYYDNAMIRHEM